MIAVSAQKDVAVKWPANLAEKERAGLITPHEQRGRTNRSCPIRKSFFPAKLFTAFSSLQTTTVMDPPPPTAPLHPINSELLQPRM